MQTLRNPGLDKYFFAQDEDGPEDEAAREKADRERIRLCFDMIDEDNSGTLDQEELLQALSDNPAVREFVESSAVLRPLLQQKMFAQAFKAMDTDDEAGVSLEEFTEFCLMTQEVVVLNAQNRATVYYVELQYSRLVRPWGKNFPRIFLKSTTTRLQTVMVFHKTNNNC